jgi:hypothetical protein
MKPKACHLIRGHGHPNAHGHPHLELMSEVIGKNSLQCFYVDMLSGLLFQMTEGMSSEHPNGVWLALAEWPERVKRNYVQGYGPLPFVS